MKVKDLIKKLQELDNQDHEIALRVDDVSDFTSMIPLEEVNIQVDTPYDDNGESCCDEGVEEIYSIQFTY